VLRRTHGIQLWNRAALYDFVGILRDCAAAWAKGSPQRPLLLPIPRLTLSWDKSRRSRAARCN